MKQVFKIDSKGFYIEPVILQVNEPTPSNCLGVFPTEGLYKPRWNGYSWVEGLSKSEIDKIKNQPVPLSAIDLLKDSDTFVLLELMNTQVHLEQERKINATLMLELVMKGVI